MLPINREQPILLLIDSARTTPEIMPVVPKPIGNSSGPPLKNMTRAAAKKIRQEDNSGLL